MDLDVLKIKRRTLKASCTRIKAYIEAIRDTRDITNETIEQLKIRKDKLDGYWHDYDEIQSQIDILEQNPESNDREIFETAYFDLKARMQHLIDNACSLRFAQQNPAAFNVNTSQQAHNNSHIRLPKLNLPVFLGKYQEWTPFSQMFCTIITNNVRLTDIEKFQYLKSSLSGDAADAIESLELSEQNFQVAWNILEHRYDKLRVIVQAHIQSILEISCIKKESYVELRQLLNVTTKHINALRALKRPVNSWNDLIVHILGNKLDPVTFRDWEDTLSSHELPRLEQLIEFLMKKCQTLESVIAKENASSLFVKSNQSISRKSAINCVTTINSKCSYCNGGHPIYFCQSFAKLPTDQRITEIRKRKICINCMKSKSHQAKQCTSSSCKTCGLKHNTLLHLNKRNDDEDPTMKRTQSAQESKEPSSPSAVVTHSMSKSVNEGVRQQISRRKEDECFVREYHVTSDYSKANFDNALTRFWRLKSEFANQSALTAVERQCEEHFLSTVKRNVEGRFIVSLPMRPNGVQQLGESRHTALARFNKLERERKTL